MKYILYDKKIDQEIDKMIEKLYAHFNPLLSDHFEFSERLAMMVRASMEGFKGSLYGRTLSKGDGKAKEYVSGSDTMGTKK